MEAEWIAAMRGGDYAAAWRINDAVLTARNPRECDDPRLPYHLRWVWRGQPARGQDVLVRCYHGLGDTLQFARYLPALRRQARSLTIEAQPALLKLLETVDGPDGLIPFVLNAPHPRSACDVEIMELPHLLRLRPQDVARPPYLHVPARLKGGIGICLRSGDWDSERSIPEPLAARRLPVLGTLSRGHDSRDSLDAGRTVFTLEPTSTTLPVCNPAGCSAAIEQTAALIAGLDLVITVDSMVAHLAGALNRPTWLLLKHTPDWRWMAGCDGSVWYPSMRLYRQNEPGNWSEVLDRVAHALMATGSPAGPSHPRHTARPG